MPSVLFLVLIGAAMGYAAATYLRLRVPMHVAIAAGALGALIGGMALKLMLSVFGAMIGALFGAALVIFIAQAVLRR